MKFETLHGNRNKKIVISAVVLFLLGITIFFNSSMAKYRVTERIPLVKGKISYSPYDISVTTKLLVGDNEYIELDEIPDSDLVSLADYTCTNDAELSWDGTENGYKIKNLTSKGTKCEAIFANSAEEFVYTGDVQTFVVPKTTSYKLEVWGAQGSGYHQNTYLGYGGTGGYSTGVVELEEGKTIYVNVGGEGTYCASANCVAKGGYNGGGDGLAIKGSTSDPGASGGGATDIRFVDGKWNDNTSLLSRLIVAGGGGAGGMDGSTSGDERGGAGGGESGYTYATENGNPGTQTSGWAFGYGFSASTDTTSYISATYGGQGGGGGWYGGYDSNADGWQGAGGGSGFVWTESTSGNVPANYSVDNKYYLTEAKTIAGNLEVPTYNGIGTTIGNEGNGYAKITALTPIAYSPKFEMEITKENKSITINVTPSIENLFETTKYYYSIGEDFVESIENSYTFNNLEEGNYSVKVYIVDSENLTSQIKTVGAKISKGSMYDILANKTINERTDFSTVLTSNTTGIVYSAEDNDGTSYYFAGSPTDNWVKFAGYYWRIVRMNGDGTIRLIYNGTSTATTGTGTYIQTSEFNIDYKNNMYVGYMYTSGEVHGLDTSSTIKGILDSWYTNNLSNYATYIDTNAGFCNDRQPSTVNSSLNGSGGTGTTQTYYASYIRLYKNNSINNAMPSLKCTNSNDLFTPNNSNKGNAKLIKPVGLITADEVAFAGGAIEKANTSYYLYNNQYYWTITPSYCTSSLDYCRAFRVSYDGSLYHDYYVGAKMGVRPVINLKADTMFVEGGIGTSTNPYIVLGAE